MSNWTKDDWENLVAGTLGVVLVALLLIGFILLLGAVFEAIPDCPDGAAADWCEGDPPDSNAI